MGAEAPTANTTASQLYTALKRDLIDGRFAAGQKLAITTLKQHYRVGLSPLGFAARMADRPAVTHRGA